MILGAVVVAQPGASPAGHWEGTIQAPNQAVEFSADLAKNQAGVWIGSLSIPMANAIGLPLTDISVQIMRCILQSLIFPANLHLKASSQRTQMN